MDVYIHILSNSNGVQCPPFLVTGCVFSTPIWCYRGPAGHWSQIVLLLKLLEIWHIFHFFFLQYITCSTQKAIRDVIKIIHTDVIYTYGLAHNFGYLLGILYCMHYTSTPVDIGTALVIIIARYSCVSLYLVPTCCHELYIGLYALNSYGLG